MKGIQVIRKYLGDFPQCYTIIGGTACDILLDNAGLSFRATKDVDMIVIGKVTSPAFTEKLGEMIRHGGYRRGWAKGDQVFYFRFDQPTDSSFPHMIEIFSQEDTLVKHIRDGNYLRLKYVSDFSPISAILMEGEYYHFARNGIIVSNGISILSEDHLIPLKIRAWLDLSAKKSSGIKVNTDDILKHKKDVYRLCQLVIPNKIVPVSPFIYADIQLFLQSLVATEETHRIDGMNIQLEFEEIVDLLKRKYLVV